MSLSNEDRHTLVRLELEKAHETFEEIDILRKAGRWSGAKMVSGEGLEVRVKAGAAINSNL